LPSRASGRAERPTRIGRGGAEQTDGLDLVEPALRLLMTSPNPF
jgi:hypothetical protein